MRYATLHRPCSLAAGAQYPAPQHQRKWGSLYDALAVGEISATALDRLLSRYPLTDGEPIYAVDVSVWPRCDAETSPERALYYHASRHAAG